MKPASATDGYVSGVKIAYQSSPNVHETRARVISDPGGALALYEIDV